MQWMARMCQWNGRYAWDGMERGLRRQNRTGPTPRAARTMRLGVLCKVPRLLACHPQLLMHAETLSGLSSLSSLLSKVSVLISMCDRGAMQGERGPGLGDRLPLGVPRRPHAHVPVRHRRTSTPPLGRRSCRLGRWQCEDIARGCQPEP